MEPERLNYLIPTSLPKVCTGDDCCQEDDYASPYRLQQVNREVIASGKRNYTTFHFKLSSKLATCNTAVDQAGCCNANITTIWMDVGE